MADYLPPTGPPPPKVPEGWKALYNEQYKEWFYVNTYTKKSQWDRPTEPVYPSSADGAPPGAPPGYDHSSRTATGPEKGGLSSNNPYGGQDLTEDEKLARKLQAEEEARAGGSASRGASDSYYGGASSGQYGQTPAYGQQSAPYGQQASPYGQQASPYGQQSVSPQPSDQKKGLFSKLTGKLGGSSSRPPQQAGYGGYPPQGYGQYPPQQYGGPGYGGYPQQAQYVQQQPQKHGMGAGGGALLGAGAGLVGGALLMDAFDDHEQGAYDQGYDQGQGGDDGGYGGDDGGGGDMGGDF